MVPHRWGDPARRANTPASPVLLLEGGGRVELEANVEMKRARVSRERSLRGAEIDLLDEQPFDGIHQALLFQRLHLTHKHTRFDCSLWISICIQWMGCRALVNANADWRRDEREEDRTHLEAFFRRHVREDEASRLALQRLQLSQPVDVVA